MKNYKPSLINLAQRAQAHESLFASLLAEYQQAQRLDDAALAARLECQPEQLARLALCRKPRPHPFFRVDVEKIAAYAQIDSILLLELIRFVETQQAFQSHPHQRLLFAARDHDEQDDLVQPEPDDPEQPEQGVSANE